MKKYLFSAIAIFGIAFSSCDNKEEIKPIGKTIGLRSIEDVSVIDGRLVFTDTTSFLATIKAFSEMDEEELNQWEEENAYVSLLTTIKNKPEITAEDSLELWDKASTEFLNKDRIVQVADYIFRIDLKSNRVDALPVDKASSNLLGELESGNIISDEIKTFSTKDNVFELLELNEAGTYGRVSGCSESGADREKKEGVYYCDSWNRFTYKVVYQPMGIYFKLVTLIQNQYKTSGGIWFAKKDDIRMDFWAGWKAKCENQKSTGYPTYWNANEISHEPYSSTKGLHKYYLTAKYGSSCINGWTNNITIQSNW